MGNTFVAFLYARRTGVYTQRGERKQHEIINRAVGLTYSLCKRVNNVTTMKDVSSGVRARGSSMRVINVHVTRKT